MIKRDEIANENSCLNKAADDEPIFVLKATDIFAPLLVRIWALLASAIGARAQKIRGASEIADQMEKWPNRKLPD